MVAQVLNGGLRAVPPAAVYALAAVPGLWLVAQVAAGAAGPDPVKALELGFGIWALRLILAGLAVTPLRRLTGINLIRWRRAIGVMAFVYVVLHLASWLVLDMGLLLAQALADIVKRPYITLGMAAALMLLPLALTSNDAALRRLGAARWRSLHRLVYPAATLAAVHYVLQGKVWIPSAIIYLGLVLLLLALRLAPRRAR